MSSTTPRSYVRHQLSTLRWLAANYADYSLQECAVQLGLPWRKVLYLCRTHGIRKRAPNKAPDPRKLCPPPTPLAVAA